MKDDSGTPVSTRLDILTLTEIKEEIRGTKRSVADWLKEAVNEKLTNDNKEKLEREIKIKKEEISLLEEKRTNFQEKENIIQKIPKTEISFFIETKKVIEQDPTFILGRINLYKNKFNKNHLRISPQEFLEMIDTAYEQNQESITMKELGVSL